MLFRGKKHRSAFVAKVAFMGYLKRFAKEEGPCAWISRDGAVNRALEEDARCQFIFTLSGYRDLFYLVRHVGRKSHDKSYPKHLPTLLLGGTMDPVGAYGEGVRRVYSRLGAAGVSPLDILLYEGVRHEAFSDTERQKIFADLLAWLRTAVLKKEQNDA